MYAKSLLFQWKVNEKKNSKNASLETKFEKKKNSAAKVAQNFWFEFS